MDEQLVLREARARVGQLRALYTHAIAFAVMNTVAFFVNVATWMNGGDWWFYWGLIAWSGLLATHALIVLGFGGLFGSAWEDRMVAEIVARGPRSQRER